VPRGYKEHNWSKDRQLDGEPPLREALGTEAEEYPLLKAVTRKRLVRILRPRRDSACGGVIGKVEISDGALIKRN
jgi:hypothetical protein